MPAFATTVLSAAVLTGLGLAPAMAGPCTKAIADFEKTVSATAKNPDAGPAAPQSVGAQLHRQPTPGSVARAEERADRAFAKVLARAKALDAAGRRTACQQALEDARMIYGTE